MKKIIILGLTLFLVCGMAAFALGSRDRSSTTSTAPAATEVADTTPQLLEGAWYREDGEIKMVEFTENSGSEWGVYLHTFRGDPNRLPMTEEGNTLVWEDWEGNEITINFRISGNTLTLSGGGNSYALSFVGVYTRAD